MTKSKDNLAIIPIERIQSQIFYIRGQKVMFDRDLAELYQVETRALNQAVRRNPKRFPDEFMFQLNKREFENWRSQIVTSNKDKMGLRRPPLVFTEQGVAMLSSVLKSERAIQVNIQIMKTFTKLREMLQTHEDLRRKIEAMEKKYDKQFRIVFQTIKLLLKEEEEPKNPIGFSTRK